MKTNTTSIALLAGLAGMYMLSWTSISNLNFLKSFQHAGTFHQAALKINAEEGSDETHYEIPYQRFLPIHVNRTQSFVHISKCAGASWIKELWQIVGREKVIPPRQDGKEWSVTYQKNAHPNYDTLMTSLKNPRAHVWSLWSECVYDKGWVRHDRIPHNELVADEINFEGWVDHFLTRSDDNNNSTSTSSSSWQPIATDDYRCYHPSNFQSRYLTAPDKPRTPRGVRWLPENSYRLEPNLERAISTLHEDMGWVAIADFFPESKCLLYYRLMQHKDLGNVANATIRNKINSYLESWCHCNDNDGDNDKTKENAAIYVSHHKGGHRSTMKNLPSSLLEKIDALVRVDTAVYRIALSTFLVEQAWLQSMLGRRVLCRQKLKQLQPELDYLGMDLIKIYDNELSHRRWEQLSNQTTGR